MPTVRTVLRRGLRQLRGAESHRPRPVPGPGPLPTCPPGWSTGPPDYVGIGTKKAGTTWWHELISAHPEVYRREPAVPGRMPRRAKELHFFEVEWDSSFSEDDAARYHAYFPRPPHRLVGEWTPRYVVDCWTPAQLSVAAPDAKLLVLVRDPLERFRSSITHYLHRHGSLEHPRALVEEVQYGCYAAGLDRFTRHFSAEQILVLQYERCVRRPEAELAATYAFLGLDQGFVPDHLRTRVAAAEMEKVRLPPGLRSDLVAEYEPDVRRLAAQWPVDLSLWPDFAHLA